MVLTDEERKAKRKEYLIKWREKPENRLKVKAKRDSPEGRKKQKEYRERPEVKTKIKEHQQSSKYKAKQKEYRERPEVKTRKKIREQKPEIKLTRVKVRNDIRLKVLQYYSKLHSNNDIPCCRCCGGNSHTDFLDIDHITGKKKWILNLN